MDNYKNCEDERRTRRVGGGEMLLILGVCLGVILELAAVIAPVVDLIMDDDDTRKRHPP